MQKKKEIDRTPLWDRKYLTLMEAAAYTGVGRDKLRELSNRDDCNFIRWTKNRKLYRRQKLDEYLDKQQSL